MVADVLDACLEDEERAGDVEHGRDNGHAPVDVRAARPAKPEEPAGEEERADHGERQAILWNKGWGGYGRQRQRLQRDRHGQDVLPASILGLRMYKTYGTKHAYARQEPTMAAWIMIQ